MFVQLAVYVSNQVPEIVVGDPGRFRQIITNLVGNSVKVHFPYNNSFSFALGVLGSRCALSLSTDSCNQLGPMLLEAICF